MSYMKTLRRLKTKIILVLVFVFFLSFINPAFALYSNNLLKNHGFESIVSEEDLTPVSWLTLNLNNKDLKTGDISVANFKRFENRSFRIFGEPEKRKAIYQEINISGKPGDTFEFSGWSKANSATNTNGHYGLILGIRYTDGSWKWGVQRFAYDTHPFEFREIELKADKSYNQVAAYCVFYNQPKGSYAWFDGLRLNKNPTFPRLMYRVNEEDLNTDAFKNLNISRVIQPYLDAQHDEMISSYLNSLPQSVSTIFPLSSRGAGWEGDEYRYLWLKGSDGYYRFNVERAKEILQKYANSPKIVAWYLYDEPLQGKVTYNELVKAYNFVKSYSSKPVGVCFCSGADFLTFKSGKGCCNFLFFDFYPYELENRIYHPVYKNDMTDHCQIEREWRAMKFGTTSNKPWFGVVQAFGRNGTKYREPTADEIINQAREYKSMGAGGIAYFSYSADLSETWYHISEKLEWQEAVVSANQEWLSRE